MSKKITKDGVSIDVSETTALLGAPAKAAEAATAQLIDMSEAAKALAEKGVAQAREVFTTLRTLADDTTEAVEHTYSASQKTFGTLQTQVLKAARQNVEASFDYVEALAKCMSPSEAWTLTSDFTAKQSELSRKQWSDFVGLSQGLARESVAPLTENFQKAFKISA